MTYMLMHWKNFYKNNIIWRYYFPSLGTYTIHSFWCYGIPTKIPQNPFCTWWYICNTFLSTCSVAFCTTHRKNNTRKCDTEGFVPVTSLNGVVGLPSLFIRSLIGINRKIWSVVYIHAKLIYSSKNIASQGHVFGSFTAVGMSGTRSEQNYSYKIDFKTRRDIRTLGAKIFLWVDCLWTLLLLVRSRPIEQHHQLNLFLSGQKHQIPRHWHNQRNCQHDQRSLQHNQRIHKSKR